MRQMQDLGGHGEQYRAACWASSNRSSALLHHRQEQGQRRHIPLHGLFNPVDSAHDRQRVQRFCVGSAL